MKEIENNPPSIIGFSISRLQYLIHLILSHKQDHHPGAYSLLNMHYMLNVVPGADKYMNFLKDHCIIEWLNYCAGRNSRMYRIKNEGKTEIRTITDAKLIRRIEQNRIKIKKLNSRKYPELNKYIHRVRINYSDAIKIVESEYLKNFKIDPVKAERRRTFSISEIEKIQAGDIYIKCNRTNGRLDSNYTRSPGEILQTLNIDGKTLIELDLRNSQPFFAATILNPTPEIEQVMNRILGRTVTMLLKTVHLSEYEDVKLYTQLVTSGDFYEPYLMKKFRANGIFFKDRDHLKELMFIIFFGKNHADKYSPTAKLFKSLFPGVQILFDLIKKDEFNRLSILLQRIESYTMLERVAKKILSEFPELPFITRHDSLLPSGIMVTEFADQVKNIMLSTITEVTGLTPVIRIKNGFENLNSRLCYNNHSISSI